MRMRPGIRVIPAAVYPLHCSPAASSRAGSHVSATFRAAAVSGMRVYSPLRGGSMRCGQSSLITDIQVPVSINRGRRFRRLRRRRGALAALAHSPEGRQRAPAPPGCPSCVAVPYRL